MAVIFIPTIFIGDEHTDRYWDSLTTEEKKEYLAREEKYASEDFDKKWSNTRYKKYQDLSYKNFFNPKTKEKYSKLADKWYWRRIYINNTLLLLSYSILIAALFAITVFSAVYIGEGMIKDFSLKNIILISVPIIFCAFVFIKGIETILKFENWLWYKWKI